MSDLYIPRIGLPIWLQKNRQTDPGNVQIAHRYMNVKIGKQNIIILGIHQSEPDTYIGLSPALHLQDLFGNNWIKNFLIYIS